MPSYPATLATPYCGAPPDPWDLSQRWHLDPGVLVLLGSILLLYLVACRDRPPWRRWSFSLGWAVAVLTIVSPLCALSVSLFSARVAEHMLLTTLAAPLIALGLPFARHDGLRGWFCARPVSAAGVFWLVLWLWHAPGPYDATFHSNLWFWSMQVTLLASALWFWTALFHRPPPQLPAAVLASFMTTGQMGLLGAIITFANHAFYAQHLVTTLRWGLTPLEDQQLGGVVMWVPAGFILVLALTLGLARVLNQTDELAPRWASS